MDERLNTGGAVDLGLFTRPEVLAAGYDDNYITRMVAVRDLAPGPQRGLHLGICVGAARTTLTVTASGREPYSARPGPRECSRTSRRWPSTARRSGTCSLDDVHLTRFDQRAGRREAGVCQHRGRLLVGDVTHRNGVMVTSPVRTALDIMASTDTEHGMVVGSSMREGRAVHAASARACVRRDRAASPFARHPGGARPRGPAPRVDRRDADRFPPLGPGAAAPANRSSRSARAAGSWLGSISLGWPQYRVWLEFDGRTKYVDYLGER